MALLNRIATIYPSMRQLGLRPLAHLAVYRLGLISGQYRRRSPGRLPFKPGEIPPFPLQTSQPGPLSIPDPGRLRQVLGVEEVERAIALADEVVDGRVRLFGAAPRPLRLAPPPPLEHWTAYRNTISSPAGEEDIKFTWEPGRLGWLYPLARAYVLTASERYPEAFWKYIELFLRENPPNMGPHWASGQEVAIRLLGMLFSVQVFRKSASSTPERLALLSWALQAHAERLPLTLRYARAQNNNHLILEALGMLAAGWALPDHPQAKAWSAAGWRYFNEALQCQIMEDGTYIQYSTTYHRVMLQAALWAQVFLRQQGNKLPERTLSRLKAASAWLLGQLDPISGDVPNYGANDGAYLFPLAGGGWRDFRPVAQAAGQAFSGAAPLPAGPWDEMSLWFGLSDAAGDSAPARPINTYPAGSMMSTPTPGRLDDASSRSWASLRAVHYLYRPSHADQLHVELWWRGQNIARDAGTYLYNGAPPWDNSLAGTAVHNTVMVDHQDQMRRAGRFLWLDWAQGRYLSPLAVASVSRPEVDAEHDGYLKLGIKHIRALACRREGQWLVHDSLVLQPGGRQASLFMPLAGLKRILGQIQQAGNQDVIHHFQLHWLLPDWDWTLDGNRLVLQTEGCSLEIEIGVVLSKPDAGRRLALSLVRAGMLISGKGPASELQGWFAPTYGEKEPALSLIASLDAALPVDITTTFKLIQ